MVAGAGRGGTGPLVAHSTWLPTPPGETPALSSRLRWICQSALRLPCSGPVNCRVLLLLLSAPFLWPAVAGGRLVFEETEISLEAEPFAEKAEVDFAFTNTGAEPVTIVDASSSCDCTVPSLAKRSYAPGEKGTIRAVFEFNERTGRQVKFLTVATDEPGRPRYELTLSVDIPQLFRVVPQVLVWRGGDAPEAKSVSIHALRPELARPVAVDSHDTRFTARLEQDGEGSGLWRVVVTPTATDTPIQATLLVQTSSPGQAARVITLYALVRESASAPASRAGSR